MTLTEYEAYKLYKKYKQKYKELQYMMEGGYPPKPSLDPKKMRVIYDGSEFDPCMDEKKMLKDKVAQRMYNSGRAAKNNNQKRDMKAKAKKDCDELKKLSKLSKSSKADAKKAEADKKKAEKEWKKVEAERKKADLEKKKKEREQCLFKCQQQCPAV